MCKLSELHAWIGIHADGDQRILAAPLKNSTTKRTEWFVFADSERDDLAKPESLAHRIVAKRAGDARPEAFVVIP
jgi:hypothetical protein